MFIPMEKCFQQTTIQHLKNMSISLVTMSNAWWQQDKEFEAFNGPI